MSKADQQYTPALKAQYNELAAKLKEQFGLKNLNEVPKLRKVVVSAGLGKAKDDKALMEAALNTLTKITGQKAVPAEAKKSIATFKIRRGMNTIGAKVTLRGDRMYEFVERLNNIILPRVRDFRGTSNNLDGQGNYNIGIVEQSIFPELSYEETVKVHGIQVTFVIQNSRDKEHIKEMLQGIGVPFKRD